MALVWQAFGSDGWGVGVMCTRAPIIIASERKHYIDHMMNVFAIFRR